MTSLEMVVGEKCCFANHLKCICSLKSRLRLLSARNQIRIIIYQGLRGLVLTSPYLAHHTYVHRQSLKIYLPTTYFIPTMIRIMILDSHSWVASTGDNIIINTLGHFCKYTAKEWRFSRKLM
jgi:hypothetical protein